MVDETAVGDDSVSDETVSNNSVVGNGVGHSVDQRGSVDGVDHRGGVDSMDSVDGGSGDVATSRGRGVLGLTGVSHLSNVAGQVVGVVGDGLDPAVGKVDGVGSLNNTGAIVGLRLLEVSLAVVISDGVGVGVGGGLGQVGGGVSSLHHRGVLRGGGGSSHEGKGDEGLIGK